MKSIAYLPASNGSANASLMTVTNIRAALASTIKVNTVANAPVKFAGTMGTPHTFTDPVTAETITIISEASAVDFFGSISGSDVVIDQIAAGYTDLGSKVGDIIVIKPITEGQNNLYNVLAQSLNDDGTIKDSAVTYNPNIIDYIQSGGIWSTLTGFNAAMTALVGWQAGLRGTVAAVASRAFTASKDTYVDVLRTTTGYTTVFSLVYTEVANGAAYPVLAANSIRLAKVVTSGAAVTGITQYKQGLLPAGYSQKRYSNGTGAYATGGATALFAVDSTNLKTPIVIRSGKLVRVDLELSGIWNQNTGYAINIDVGLDGAVTKSSSGTQSIFPAGYGNNWTTDGAARVTWDGTFYFEDVSPGYHNFLLLWATSNASFGGFLGQYAQQTITVTELA